MQSYKLSWDFSIQLFVRECFNSFLRVSVIMVHSNVSEFLYIHLLRARQQVW